MYRERQRIASISKSKSYFLVYFCKSKAGIYTFKLCCCICKWGKVSEWQRLQLWLTDWGARRHLKTADKIGLATARSHADSQESGQGADCVSSCLPCVRYQHGNRGRRRGAALTPLCTAAEGTEIAQCFPWGPVTLAYSCFVLICSWCLVTWV